MGRKRVSSPRHPPKTAKQRAFIHLTLKNRLHVYYAPSAIIEGEIENERPMIVDLDSAQPKHKAIEPAVSINWPNGEELPRTLIRLKPNFNEHDEDQGAKRKLNAAFWLGVTAGQAIAEGQADAFIAEREKR